MTEKGMVIKATHSAKVTAPLEGNGRITFTDKEMSVRVDVPMDTGIRLILTIVVVGVVAAGILVAGIYCLFGLTLSWTVYFILGYLFTTPKTVNIPYQSVKDVNLSNGNLKGKYTTEDGEEKAFELKIMTRDPERLEEMIKRTMMEDDPST